MFAVGSLASQALKLLNGLNITNVQSRDQVCLRGVNTTAVQVTSKQHHVEQMRRAVEGQVARALVLLTGIQSRLDNGLSIDIVIAEALRSIGALKLRLLASDINILMDAVQLVIMPDRADVIFLDLIGIGILTTVADQDSLSQSLIHGMTHNLPLVSNNIEISDIENVITIDLVLDVDGLSIMSTTKQLDLLHLLLVVTLLLVTHGLQLGLASISTTGANAAIRRLMNAIDNTGHPSVIGIENLRLLRVNILVLRQEHIHRLSIESVMLQLVLILVDLTSLLKATNTRSLGELDDLVEIRVGQDFLVLHAIGVKNIVFHFISSLRMFHFFAVIFFFVFIFVFIFIIIGDITNHRIDGLLLFLSKRVKHIANGLFIRMLKRFIVFIHVRFFLRFIIFITMKNCDVLASENSGFLFAFLTVLNNRFDRRTRVRASKHQTHLSNIAMNNIRHILFKLVSINGEGHNVAVLNKQLASLARFRVIKCAICINAFVTVLKKSVAKNLIWVIMTMIPNKRNGLTIIVLKSIFHDNSAIRAF